MAWRTGSWSSLPPTNTSKNASTRGTVLTEYLQMLADLIEPKLQSPHNWEDEGKGRRGIGTGPARLGTCCGRMPARQEPPAGLAGWPGQVGHLRGWRAWWSWPTELKGTEGPTRKVLATSPHFQPKTHTCWRAWHLGAKTRASAKTWGGDSVWLRRDSPAGLEQGPGHDCLCTRAGGAAGCADGWPSRCSAGMHSGRLLLWWTCQLEPCACVRLGASGPLVGSRAAAPVACTLVACWVPVLWTNHQGLIPQEQNGMSAVCRKAGPRQEWGEVAGLPGPASPLISLNHLWQDSWVVPVLCYWSFLHMEGRHSPS